MLKSSKSAKFFRMALWAALIALSSVVFNAYARLSEAGLGCPDWPGCYGKLFAPLTAQDIERAKSYEGERKETGERVWKETTQRAIAVSLAFVLLRLTVLGWQLKKRKRSQQVLIPGMTALLVATLTVLGVLTFTHRYTPLVQMMQIVGGMTVLALLWWIVMREQRFFRSVSASAVARSLRPRTLILLVLASLQFALGGWSMVNYAGLACPDFPTCQGSWWPGMEVLDGFTLWQDLGIDYESRLLNLPAATALHMAHRVGALVTLLYGGWLAMHILRVGNEENLCRYGLLVLIMLSFAAVLGVMQVVLHLPLAVAVGHSAASALLLMSLVTLYHVVRAPKT
jgi:cytochrome c oxidase assembly protein subunit 15